MSKPIAAEPTPRRTLSPIRLAFWAAADKALPMIYGVAVIVVILRTLDTAQWAIWTIFQTLFLVISLLAEFFILQPMVKICSEHDTDPHPVITAAILLYSTFSLGLAFVVGLLAAGLESIFKTPGSSAVFVLMVWLVLSTIVRNVAIRILQIDYRIVGIFMVDLAYFAVLIGLMVHGMLAGTLKTAHDLVDYNLIGFAVSSIVGAALVIRDLLPTLRDIRPAVRRILEIGVHQGGTGLLTVLQQQSDVPIISGVRGGTAAAVYNAARTFYRVFEALRDAGQLLLVPATSRAYSQDRVEAVQEVTELATAALVAVLVPTSAALVLAAPYLVPIILPKFPEAIDEFQWLMATGFVMPFVIVPSAVLLGIGHTRDLFRGTFVGTAVLVLGGLALTWFFGSTGMAAGVFLGTVATAILLTQRMNRYVHFTFRSVLLRSRSFAPLIRRRLAALKLTGGRAGSNGSARAESADPHDGPKPPLAPTGAAAPGDDRKSS